MNRYADIATPTNEDEAYDVIMALPAYHPDDRACEVVTYGGRSVFHQDEWDTVDILMAACVDILGDDVYDIAMDRVED